MPYRVRLQDPQRSVPLPRSPQQWQAPGLLLVSCSLSTTMASPAPGGGPAERAASARHQSSVTCGACGKDDSVGCYASEYALTMWRKVCRRDSLHSHTASTDAVRKVLGPRLDLDTYVSSYSWLCPRLQELQLQCHAWRLLSYSGPHGDPLFPTTEVGNSLKNKCIPLTRW